MFKILSLVLLVYPFNFVFHVDIDYLFNNILIANKFTDYIFKINVLKKLIHLNYIH